MIFEGYSVWMRQRNKPIEQASYELDNRNDNFPIQS